MAARVLPSLTALLAAGLFVAAPAGAGDSVPPDWVAVLGKAAVEDIAREVVFAPGGERVYAVGDSASAGTRRDLLLTANQAATGRRLWATRYNVAPDRVEIGSDLGVSPDGRLVFATGYSEPWRTAREDDYVTMAVRASDGARLWVDRYDSPRGASDRAHALAVSPDGRTVVVTGTSAGRNTGFDPLTIAYDARTGERRWIARASTASEAFAVAVSPNDATVFVAARDAGEDVVVIAYALATGRVRWLRTYDRAGAREYPNAIVAAGGSLYVTGAAQPSADPEAGWQIWTLAISGGSGALRWEHTAGPDGFANHGAAIVHDAVHDLVVVAGDSGADAAVVAVRASDGVEAWSRTFDGSAHGPDAASDLALGASGERVFVSGWSAADVDPDDGSIDGDAMVWALATATGAVRWQSAVSLHAGREELALGIDAAARGGRVAVAGLSRIGENNAGQHVVLGYCAAGPC